MSYIITDWASNVLQYDGKFNFSAYGAYHGVPMEFKTFEDAWDYIDDREMDKDADLYVVKL